jgi:hypothetical protein
MYYEKMDEDNKEAVVARMEPLNLENSNLN